jgi:hypothetical protein
MPRPALALRIAIPLPVLCLVVIGCSAGPGQPPAAHTPVPLPTRTPLLGFGACAPLALGRPVTYPIGLGPHSIAAGDLSGDGNLDLVVADPQADTITILLGDGLGGFSQAPGSPLFVGRGPVFADLADFTDDGHLDVAVVHARSNDLWLLVNDGAASLKPAAQSPSVVGPGPTALAGGDFNRDGRQDLAVALGGDSDASVSVLLGDGAGGLHVGPGSPLRLASGPALLALAADDVTGDGVLDLLVAIRETDALSVLVGDDTGGFLPPPYATLPVGGGPVAIGLGDLNGDTVQDIATANSRTNDVTILLGAGTGAFRPTAEAHEIIDGPASLTVADMDGDGKLDVVVVVVEADDVSFLLGDGSGDFRLMAPPPRVISGGRPPNPNLPFAGYIASHDLNHDGRPDLVVANTGSGDVSVLMNRCS